MFRKYASILQHDSKDCGAACLATIGKHYGLHIPLSKIREMAGTDLHGTTVFGMVKAAKMLGFEAKAIKGHPACLFESFPMPAIAHIEVNQGFMHYVVIHHVSEQAIVIADPSHGIVTYPPDHFAQLWSGVLILMQPAESFTARNEKQGLLKRFIQLLVPHRKLLFGVFMASILYTMIGIAVAFYFRLIVDELIPNRLIDQLHIISWGVVLLVIGKIGLQALRSFLLLQLGQRLDKVLILGYYQHIVQLPMNFFSTRQTGEVISRFQDASKVRDALSSASLTIMIDSLMILAGGCMLYSQNSVLFALTLCFVPIYLGIVWKFQKPYEQQNRRQMEDNEMMISYMVESIKGIETIKACHAEQQTSQKAETKFYQVLKSLFRLACTLQWQSSLKSLVQALGSILILWAGAYQVIQGHMTIGQLLTFNALLVYFLEPLQNLVHLQPQIQTAVIAADRLAEILDLDRENSTSSDCLRDDLTEAHVESKSGIHHLRGDLEIDDLVFRYGARPPILQHIQLCIAQGEKIAFVGESGSGKSTLAKLLIRLYQAEQGSIRIANHRIQDIPLAVLRARVAYISQEPFFFSGTIYDNLCLGTNSPIALEQIIELARKVKMDEYIRSLPLGYYTLLEENGSNLSGGQKQRLAIIRGLLKQPDLLILDEATSQLDTTTEQAISQMILQLENMTTIVIAHRLSSIRGCDRIYVMEHGHIIEQGNHHHLIEQQGKYAELWHNQGTSHWVEENERPKAGNHLALDQVG